MYRLTEPDMHSREGLRFTPVELLDHLDRHHRPARVSPARGPPQAEFEFDQSSAHDWDA